MLKRPLAVLAALTLSLSLAACGDDDGSASSTAKEADGPSCTYTSDGSPAAKEVDLPPDSAAYSGEVAGTIETSAGDIGITLDADAAPCTVNSFVSLAEQGYFDDTQCHRLTQGGLSVLQCGDPTATGSGGPGFSFADELEGDETYGAGTLAMANAGPDTNGSQFFMVYADSQLSADYTVFGSIDEAGVGILEEIAARGLRQRQRPRRRTPADPGRHHGRHGQMTLDEPGSGVTILAG